MKKIKLFAWVLCFVMCLNICTPVFAAGETITGAQINLSNDTLSLTGVSQTVTATIGLDISGGQTVAAAGMNYDISLPEGWTVSDFEVPEGVMSSITSTGGMWILSSGTVDVKTLVTMTLSIPADVKAGTYTIAVSNVKVVGAQLITLYSGGTATATLTVADDDEPTEPANYTITISDGVEGTAEIEPEDAFTMTVTADQPVNGLTATIAYDTELFTCTEDEDGAGEIAVGGWYKQATTDITTLHFAAKAETEGTGKFTITSVNAGAFDDFYVDASEIVINTVGDAVTVKPATVQTYTVTVDEDIKNGAVEVDKTTAATGETVTLTVTPKDGYKLEELTVTAGEETVEVEDNTFTMPAANVTVTATFKALEQPIDVLDWPTGMLSFECPEDAVTDQEVTVSAEAEEGYELEAVKAYDKHGEEVSVTDNGNGTYTFTMPAGGVEIEFIVKKAAAPAFTVETFDEYVTGYTLVVVTGDAEDGYAYNGVPMIKIPDGKYGYLVSRYDASKVAVNTGAACGDITGDAAYDVNGTDKVDFNDAGAAFGCYNVAYDVDTNMAMYLRADVNGDHKADGDDVSVIMNNYTK